MSLPKCSLVYVECTENPNFQFGRLIIRNNEAGSTAQLICAYPDTLVGNSTIVCDSRGHWSGKGYCGKCISLLYDKTIIHMVHNWQVSQASKTLTVGSVET